MEEIGTIKIFSVFFIFYFFGKIRGIKLMGKTHIKFLVTNQRKICQLLKPNDLCNMKKNIFNLLCPLEVNRSIFGLSIFLVASLNIWSMSALLKVPFSFLGSESAILFRFWSCEFLAAHRSQICFDILISVPVDAYPS